MKHLWEVDHPYYCAEGNYYAPGNEQPGKRYKSWAEFMAAMGDADMDYNMLFRWDWREGDGYDLADYNGDDNYRHAELAIYWMGQRKGLYYWSVVEVCRNDEPAIIDFLRPRWEYLKSLWEPIAG